MTASLFVHCALDLRPGRGFPAVEFGRDADDAVAHCAGGYQARKVLAALHGRTAEAGLELHPGKTRIAYCEDSSRRGPAGHTPFTFPGFTVRPRQARRKDGVRFTSSLPAASKDALKKTSAGIRSWRLHRRVSPDGRETAKLINPKIRGWTGYHGASCTPELYPVPRRISTRPLRRVMNKYKNRSTWEKATRTLTEAAGRRPQYPAHRARVKPAAR